ncbi:MAG: hypothetical protein V4490_05735 [Pseudomonadota bacterium]
MFELDVGKDKYPIDELMSTVLERNRNVTKSTRTGHWNYSDVACANDFILSQLSCIESDSDFLKNAPEMPLKYLHFTLSLVAGERENFQYHVNGSTDASKTAAFYEAVDNVHALLGAEIDLRAANPLTESQQGLAGFYILMSNQFNWQPVSDRAYLEESSVDKFGRKLIEEMVAPYYGFNSFLGDWKNGWAIHIDQEGDGRPDEETMGKAQALAFSYHVSPLMDILLTNLPADLNAKKLSNDQVGYLHQSFLDLCDVRFRTQDEKMDFEGKRLKLVGIIEAAYPSLVMKRQEHEKSYQQPENPWGLFRNVPALLDKPVADGTVTQGSKEANKENAVQQPKEVESGFKRRFGTMFPFAVRALANVTNNPELLKKYGVSEKNTILWKVLDAVLSVFTAIFIVLAMPVIALYGSVVDGKSVSDSSNNKSSENPAKSAHVEGDNVSGKGYLPRAKAHDSVPNSQAATSSPTSGKRNEGP